MTSILIESANYSGQSVNILFNPSNTSLVLNLGTQVLPFAFTGNTLIPPVDVYGTYTVLTLSGDCVLILNVPRPTPLLLDTYPTTASAYSLRKLSNSYVGSAIRVRRSNDNSESDIGFSGNDLDLVTLSGFVGSNNAFVTTWYDQSGNGNNATQSTASQQPRIMLSGVTETNVKGKPGIRIIDNTTVAQQQQFRVPIWHASNDTWVGVFSVYQLNANGFYPYIQGSINTDRGFLILHDTTTRQVRTATDRTGGTTAANGSALNLSQLYLRFDLANRTRMQTYLDGSSSATIDVADSNSNFRNPSTTYLMGDGNNNSVQIDTNISEFITYKTNQSSNKSGIETNIKNYWGI